MIERRCITSMSRYSKQNLSIQVRKNIRKYRIIRNYTLQQLADMTDLTHGYVRDLECLTINKTPTLETIGKFADALGIDIRQLFDDVDNN
ncbi:MAG: helix-turn-helix transcriptional regulator [Firmicutes bacterium]|nr:helix-turn-helix transcriptional regulator [Bacillota bacterium]